MKLEIQHVACGYGKKVVVQDLSVEVNSGEVLCILGPNGVGKTTFFKTVMDFLPPISGEIRLNGECIQPWSRKKLARHLGYVPQAHIPPFPFSVMDVVSMGRTAHLNAFSSPSAKDLDASYAALEQLGVGKLSERIYTELSGGERQMVLIARALAQKPDFLLMDEPTSNLDFGNQVRVLKCIDSLVKSGLAVIMTSHAPDHAFLCRAKVALLYRENRIDVGSADEVITEKNLRSAYGVDVKVADIGIPGGLRLKTCIPLLHSVPVDPWESFRAALSAEHRPSECLIEACR